MPCLFSQTVLRRTKAKLRSHRLHRRLIYEARLLPKMWKQSLPVSAECGSSLVTVSSRLSVWVASSTVLVWMMTASVALWFSAAVMRRRRRRRWTGLALTLTSTLVTSGSVTVTPWLRITRWFVIIIIIVLVTMARSQRLRCSTLTANLRRRAHLETLRRCSRGSSSTTWSRLHHRAATLWMRRDGWYCCCCCCSGGIDVDVVGVVDVDVVCSYPGSWNDRWRGPLVQPLEHVAFRLLALSLLFFLLALLLLLLRLSLSQLFYSLGDCNQIITPELKLRTQRTQRNGRNWRNDKIMWDDKKEIIYCVCCVLSWMRCARGECLR